MSLKKLSDQELLYNVKNLVGEERRTLTEVLRHLREIESRRLYLAQGYSSLFSFCVEFLGYEESQAQRRISATRLIAQIPEVEAKIESGSLSLTALTQAQSFFRQEAQSAKPMTLEGKKGVLAKLENKSVRQVEKELVALRPDFALRKLETVKSVSPDSSELKLVISNESLEGLEKLKNLLAQKTLNNKQTVTLASVVNILIKEGLAKHDPVLKAQRINKRKAAKRFVSRIEGENTDVSAERKRKFLLDETAANAAPSPSAPNAAPLQDPPRKRHIAAVLRREVWLRDQGRCTFTEPITGKVCGSEHRLQVDHIIPWALGGAHSLDNLRLRCAAHNIWHATEIFGETKTGQYIKR